MNKKKMIIIIAAVLLLAGGVAAAVYVIRNINETASVVVEQTVDTMTPEEIDQPESRVVVESSFQGVDAIHWGKGSVEIIETADGPLLSFGEDVEIAQGPDLFVYLSPNAADEELGDFASLGTLKANEGAQVYNLPDNYEDYKTVVVWCRAVGITFATVDIM
jgi:hypothetical protein